MSLSLPLKLSFAAPLTLLALVGCSSEGGDGQGDQESSVVQSEEVTKLTRSNESLAWELERMRLKVITVDGEDMVKLKKKGVGLWHYDVQVKPFTGRAVNKFENGKPYHDASFYEGKLDGVETFWYPNGQVWKEKMWLEGEYHGFVTEWDANGNIMSRKHFQRGEEKTNQ